MALLLVFSISKADFAKPVRITLAAAVQPLARIININADEIPSAKPVKAGKPIHKTPAAKPMVTPAAVPQPSLTSLIAIAPMAVKPDTNKELKISFAFIKKDSLVFVINGVVSTSKTLDPTKIENMYILTGDNARKFVKIDDDKPVKVAYIITKDAPNKDELEKDVPNITFKKVNTNLSGYTVLNDNDNINVVTVGPVSKSGGKTYSNVKTYISKNTTSSSSGTGSSSITINGVKAKPTALSYSIKSDDDAIVANGGDVVVTGYGKKANVKALNANGMSIMTNGDKDPLIVIDGKTSSTEAFKKLNPDKIESISILKGDDSTKKYGDKAKDGVVVITTRKK